MTNETKRKDLFEQWVESGEVENNLAIIEEKLALAKLTFVSGLYQSQASTRLCKH